MATLIVVEDLAASCPEWQALAAGLQALWNASGTGDGPVTVLDRQPNLYASTFPSEVVTCTLPDGSRRRLLCKYSADQSSADFGHRGGVGYEAEVYRQVLEPLHTSTPRFYGAATDPRTGRTWLVIEYLEGGWRMDETAEPEPEVLAAQWIGRFHAANEARVAMPFLRAFDPAYYRGWARRAAQLAGRWGRRFRWLATLCGRCPDALVPLLTAAPTVIHGEFYPHNILVRDGAVCPVDWESAALAAGEIDLASLTEGWPDQAVTRCEREYRQARWPEGAPADFERKLAAARLYLALHWLADEPHADETGPSPCYLDHQLRRAGERLGLI